MLFDAENLFSDAQAVTATAASTNVIDLGSAGDDYGPGNPVPLLIQVVETFTAGGSATLTIALQLDSTETFTPDKSIPIASAVPVADLVAGKRFHWNYLPEGVDLQYARLHYTVATGPMTAGKITAGLVAAIQTNG
ncbi:Bbp16 family capsid cement protein [Thalassospira povalilytica]|uniref:Bbp16 family capsid cement protein n=1 Tax=Thalassospira povalilytica TaxID=732237 RepID=UPI003AA7B4CE